MNVVLNGPGLESHPNSMLIAFWDEKCKKTRHIFVYAEVGKVSGKYPISSPHNLYVNFTETKGMTESKYAQLMTQTHKA